MKIKVALSEKFPVYTLAKEGEVSDFEVEVDELELDTLIHGFEIYEYVQKFLGDAYSEALGESNNNNDDDDGIVIIPNEGL